MVNIKLVGYMWRAQIECAQCHIARITQMHDRTRPWVTVESEIKTTARTLGWKIGREEATCGACRKNIHRRDR